MKNFWRWLTGRMPVPDTPPPPPFLLWGIGLVVLVLYALTAQPVVGFEDSAGFAAACYYADIAHAPGYPLYSLLCHPFSYLPFSDPAGSAALFSAVCAAAAVVVLLKIIYLLTGDAITAAGGALLFAVSRSFWGQAVIAEVYTLNVLLFFLALLQLLHWRCAPSVWRLARVLLLSALALANHWPLFILAAPAFIPLLWKQRGWLIAHLLQPRCLLLWLAVLIIGLLPYGYLYWRAHFPAAFFRLPLAPDSFSDLWWVISREGFTPIDNPEGYAPADKVAYFIFLARRLFIDEIGLPGGIFILLGLLYQWRNVGAAAATALVLLFTGATLVLLLLLNFLYNELGAQTFSRYPLLPYAVGCIWAALAVRQLFGTWRLPVLAALAVFALIMNYPYNNRHNDTLAAEIADTYLTALPPGAFFPFLPLYELMVYRQHITGQRPDVQLLPSPSPYIQYTITPGEKLYPPNTLPFAEEVTRVNAFVADNPTCYNTYIPFTVPKLSQEYLLFSCLRDDTAAEYIIQPDGRDFLFRLSARYDSTTDWQERRFIGRILLDTVRTLMQLSARQALPPVWAEILETLSTTPAGQLAVMEYLVSQPALTLSAERAALFEQAARINASKLTRRQRARLFSALADSFAAVSPRSDQTLTIARHYHQQAAAIMPAASAPAVRAAYNFYQREQLVSEMAQLKARYGDALHAETDVIEE